MEEKEKEKERVPFYRSLFLSFFFICCVGASFFCGASGALDASCATSAACLRDEKRYPWGTFFWPFQGGKRNNWMGTHMVDVIITSITKGLVARKVGLAPPTTSRRDRRVPARGGSGRAHLPGSDSIRHQHRAA